ncbi:Phosphotyrosyl phosphatase activator [Sporormia fimetaria CBS 119925]|uniref:Serine/threonine-protein phosphatase 2A activator n=1 Tax=Sporormia fimetaria CBS 119925 TaxID=1340428 RepID=A0A6A6UXY7_9PLEO|nr:Phosphotyrosyl phosphatase activator [Sporormia fimetaria CBS 119925]
MATSLAPIRKLQVLDPATHHEFMQPVKCINEGGDLSFFLKSKAYTDIMTFIFQLNAAMFPRVIRNAEGQARTKQWTLGDPDVSFPPVVHSIAALIEKLGQMIEENPPDQGPRRFGNVSFRRWYESTKVRASELLDEYLPAAVLSRGASDKVSAKAELQAYFLGSFGSSQRLDYGTGHELSFLAFLGCLWKLGAFPESQDGSQERAIVLGVIEPYLQLIRRLILIYTLEPAGSHGVWGLDDHSFLPYIFGSAQYSPAITTPADIVQEGSLPNAPDPGDVAKANVVERERRQNMYFSAIGFIYDVKKGPFWEHSPILFDISGVKAGWAKINKGMLKMYNAEVLSKFPVVQHFPMGSLFVWEADPMAIETADSIHASSQPSAKPAMMTTRPVAPLRNPLADAGSQTTRASWAGSTAIPQGPAIPSGPNQPTRAPWASSTPQAPPGGPTTAPWSRNEAAGGRSLQPASRGGDRNPAR